MVHPILVCTYTNVAVDNLVEGLITAGLDPVRIGYAQTKSTLQEHSFEFRIERHPLYPKYKVVSENIESLEKDLKKTCASISEHLKRGASSPELSRLRSYRNVLHAKLSRSDLQMQAIYQQMQTEVLTNADVVRYFIPCAFTQLTITFRYALPVSVLGPGR